MDAKWIVNLSGRDYPLWAGILNEAHERGLQSIETQLIQIPHADNDHTAIVKAKATMKDGSFFEGLGDASPRNTNARIATALLRMAETRAKGRALRDAINVGQTMLEELPGDEHEASIEKPSSAPKAPATPRPAGGGATGPLVCSHPGCGLVLTRGQHDVSQAKYQKPLCPAHQREERAA